MYLPAKYEIHVCFRCEISFNQLFTVRPLDTSTSIERWPSPIIVISLVLSVGPHMPSLRFTQVFILEIIMFTRFRHSDSLVSNNVLTPLPLHIIFWHNALCIRRTYAESEILYIFFPYEMTSKSFQSTSGELKWPLTSSKTWRDHLLDVGHRNVWYHITANWSCCDIMLVVWFPMTQNDLWPYQITNDTWYGTSKC